jgi:hypothetical protein
MALQGKIASVWELLPFGSILFINFKPYEFDKN